MIPYERRQQMLQIMEDNEFVTIEQLVNELDGISESTARRDLKALSDDGLVTLVRGGASRVRTGSSYDTGVDSRLILNAEAKERIAKCAADLVKDGEVIYIDAGSTTLKMIPYLKNKDITIVTSNVLIFQEMIEAKAECIIVGGHVLMETGSVVGDMTVTMLENMYFDRAFFGMTGVSVKAGFTTPDLKESRKKKIAKEHSKYSYILADNSKVGIITMCKVFNLEEITLITDQESSILKECASYIIAR